MENGSNAKALHSLGITGNGINVGLISVRNVRSTHSAFNDSNGVHVFNYDFSGSGVGYTGLSPAGHDTWVAGIIASRGWTGHTSDVGVSPGCNIYSARVLDDTCDVNITYLDNALNTFITAYNCKVFVLPIQFTGKANGSSSYSKMIDYYAYANDVVFALASGNDLSYPTIFGDAYNGITAGALIDEPNDYYFKVGSKSNPGPTIDYRKKPEICCPGSRQITPSIDSDTSYYTTIKDGATSFAVPHTGGVAALLLQYANQTSDADDGHNVVIKAAIVNSAFPNIKDKDGAATYPADPNNVWHKQRGYGKIDALRAYQTLSAGRVSKSSTITSTAGWAYYIMDANQTHNYLIAGQEGERLVLTVTWNRLITKTGSTYNVDSPIFKINLTVKNPSGSTIYHHAGDANNLERIELILPADGNYTVSLSNATSKSRPYGLAFELLEPLSGDFNLDYIVDDLDLQQIAYEWLSSGVNCLDFADFAKNWMKTDKRYYNP